MENPIGQHPRALPYLFLTEMWERFGFYIVQGLLVLYMTGYFKFSDSESYMILGVFTALAYISPLLGGYIASRLLGYRTAILWGGCFLILGYALLSLRDAKIFFYPALATIVVGNGLFKPNISSLLGSQYEEDDLSRDAGFTIFYIGINIGAFLAGLSSGYIKEYFGWSTSFFLASLGLIIGLLTFISGFKTLKANTASLQSTGAFKIKLLICSLLAIAAVSFLLKVYFLANWLLPIIGIILLILLTAITLQQSGDDRRKMMILNILIISSIVFWMLFLQMFYSANLFVARLVDRDYFGIHLSTTIFWGSESIFIILLGPFFAQLWQKLAKLNKNPSAITKFYLGIFAAGIGFVVLALSTFMKVEGQLINPCWIFLSYFLITIGELLISPIGLSAVTQLAPTSLTGLMMGVWFVATGLGGYFAGMIAEIASIPDTLTLESAKLAIYQQAFLDYAYLAFFVAIILFFVQLAMKFVEK